MAYFLGFYQKGEARVKIAGQILEGLLQFWSNLKINTTFDDQFLITKIFH